MTITQAISAFDGQRTSALAASLRSFSVADANTIAKFCCQGTPLERAAASWLVKALCERGKADDLPLGQIFDLLSGALDWSTALHLLQSVPYRPDKADADAVGSWMTHNKVLVRVWAMNALWHVDRSRALPKVHAALNDRSAAMRARARLILSE